MKSKIFSVAITFALFFSAKIALAETIVDLDIYVDTTWTKEMSPIVIKSNTRNDMIRRVINGATLTIEPGVVVRFEKGMSLQIFSSCLRGYNSETCYRDDEDNIKMPRLIARGTAIDPIIFTSNEKEPLAGDWGSVVLDAPNNEVEWAEFRFGGLKSKRAFIEVNNSLFQNNLVEKIGTTEIVILASSQTLEGNTIRENFGEAIFCEHDCSIIDNFIAKNVGNAVVLDTLLPTEISGNFIYQNGGNAVLSESIYSFPVEISGNFFRENSGGIYFDRSSSGLLIHENNFLKNENFAIKSVVNNREGMIYEAKGNWFGIDTGSRNLAGQFFVSSDFDVSDFKKEGNDFEITGSSKAARDYREYLSENNLKEAFFDAKVKRSVLFGNENLPGSILLYSVSLENRTTTAIENIVLEASVVGDQVLLFCSVETATADFNYSFATACSSLADGIAFERNRLIWRPSSISAMSEQTLFFATAIVPNAKNISLPKLFFTNNGTRQGLDYSLDSTFEISEKTESENSELPEIQTPPVVEPEIVQSEVVSSNGALVTGTVSRQFFNGILNYVLTTTEGKNYSLLNKWKWREIDNFTKSADKDKPIAVFGEFYFNRFGIATGVKFTRFDILN